MSILGLTLARAGSRGVRNKHTRDLCGKPVIAWTMEAAQKSKLLDRYVVSSNDPVILRIADGYNVKGIERPGNLAQDDTPTLPALQHAILWCEKFFNKTFDFIIEIRATSPLKTTEDIDGIIQRLIESDADSVIGVACLEDHHPARIKWLDKLGYINDFLPEPSTGRRQDLEPKAYIRNGTVYAFRRAAIMPPDGKLFGHEKSIGFILPSERSINIDTELDFKLCEVLLHENTFD